MTTLRFSLSKFSLSNLALSKFSLTLLAFCLLLLGAIGGAGAQTLIHSTDWTTAPNTATGAANTTLYDGWIDVAGSNASVSGGVLRFASPSNPFSSYGYLLRPASENVRDQQFVDYYTQTSGAADRYTVHRYQGNNTDYLVGASGNTVPANTLVAYRSSGGSLTAVGTAASFTAPATGDQLRRTTTVSGANPTTLTETLYDVTTSATIATFTATDSNGPQVSGQIGIMAVTSNVAATKFQTYSTLTTSTSLNPSHAPLGSSLSVVASGSGTSWVSGTTTFSVVGGTGASISGLSINNAAQTATFTLNTGTTAGALTMSNSTDSATAVFTVDTNLVTVIPNSSALLYSPYNWLVTGSSAKTINAGAYFRTQLNGTASCVIGLNIGAATPYSQCVARLDGGAWQKYTPTTSGAQSWTLTMPTGTTAPNHFLEFIVKSTTETQDRWTAQTTAVQVTGLTLDAGATVSAPVLRKYRVLIYGDSITEGVRVNGYTGITNDTDRNDNTLDYSYKLAELLDAEVGVVGFGATGMTVAGSGNVPALPSAYNLLWSGQARTFTTVPDLVIYNEGTNESAATLSAMQTAFNTVINGIGYTGTGNTFTGLNGTRHLVLRPFGGNQAANLSTIASSFNSANVVYGNTTGFWATADSSDNLHPYGYAHLGSIAPSVASLALPLLKNFAAAVGTKRRIQ